MQKVLILGAGRSSSSLISYLLDQAKSHSWEVSIGDISLEAAQQRVAGRNSGSAMHFDIKNETQSREAIANADVVVSLLPADFHAEVARHCLRKKKHLVTASYVSPQMELLHADAKSSGVTFLNECGLDPGIDHMSAMMIIDRIRSLGGTLISFESFAGGLIAPDTDPENPWRYKFSWSPRNVVMAGQSVARFREQGHRKFIPYQQLFKRTTSVIVPGYGSFVGYANRDSLKYLDVYGLNGIKTIIRGTLRYKGFCDAWNVLVQLGCCDDTYVLSDIHQMTHREYVNLFMPYSDTNYLESKLALRFGLAEDGEEMKRIAWSGFFENENIGLDQGSPAQITEYILNKKWKLSPHDRDMIVMWHRFIYEVDGRKKEIQASLVVKGDDSINTAMAKTVGLPMGIAAKLLLDDQISEHGVILPVFKDIYEPILSELKQMGVVMHEQEREV
jgi:saccharopine dehydrogenase (NADP+, L-glutamate forming)